MVSSSAVIHPLLPPYCHSQLELVEQHKHAPSSPLSTLQMCSADDISLSMCFCRVNPSVFPLFMTGRYSVTIVAILIPYLGL
jgi:hypothetical protein